jgi:hypothetical protein
MIDLAFLISIGIERPAAKMVRLPTKRFPATTANSRLDLRQHHKPFLNRLSSFRRHDDEQKRA